MPFFDIFTCVGLITAYCYLCYRFSSSYHAVQSDYHAVITTYHAVKSNYHAVIIKYHAVIMLWLPLTDAPEAAAEPTCGLCFVGERENHYLCAL